MNNLPLGPLMVDIAGLTLDAQEKQHLCSPMVGAVILFSRNYKNRQQVTELIREIKSLRHPQLLVAVDQEGGRVQRFRDDFFPLPALKRIGECYRSQPNQALEYSYCAGRLMALELADVGVDFSFAPVLDIADIHSDVIGDRAFHPSAEVITELAEAHIRGMNSAGMSATGKHFPGHGGVAGDSHHMKPVDPRPMEELQSRDLKPFSTLAKQLDGVMTAHVDFPNIDSRLPTFSPFWIHQILRQSLGFDGVVFSDDLSMKGAHEAGSPLDRTVAALDAGCDMALICNDPQSARAVAESLDIPQPPVQTRMERMRLTNLAQEDDLDSLRDYLSTLD